MRIKKTATHIGSLLGQTTAMKNCVVDASAMLIDISKYLNAGTSSKLLQLFSKLEIELDEVIQEAKLIVK